MFDSKGTMSADNRDLCELFDFVTEKKRFSSEIDGFINSLAHQKYPYPHSQEGHDLRMKYKKWLRFRLKKMLGMYYAKKKCEPNALNNSSAVV